MNRKQKGYLYTGVALIIIGFVLSLAAMFMDSIVASLEAQGMTVIAPFTGIVFWLGIIIIVIGILYTIIGMLHTKKRW